MFIPGAEVNITWNDGYTATPLKALTVGKGGDYSSLYPETPVREGFTFSGWSSPVTDDNGNITITAQWNAHVHDYKQTKAPTCTEPGEEKCDCGDTRPIPATGHQWSDWKESSTNPGNLERTCEKCGLKETKKQEGTTNPTNPDDSTKPGNAPANSANAGNSPQTGDSSNVALWLILMLVSASYIALFVMRERKTHRN